MVYYNRVAHAKLFSQLAEQSAITTEQTMNALILVTDLALALSLVVLLYNSRSGLRRTDTVVKLLSTYVISTSLITAIVQCLCLAAVIAYPDSLAYIAADLVASKCERAPSTCTFAF